MCVVYRSMEVWEMFDKMFVYSSSKWHLKICEPCKLMHLKCLRLICIKIRSHFVLEGQPKILRLDEICHCWWLYKWPQIFHTKELLSFINVVCIVYWKKIIHSSLVVIVYFDSAVWLICSVKNVRCRAHVIDKSWSLKSVHVNYRILPNRSALDLYLCVEYDCTILSQIDVYQILRTNWEKCGICFCNKSLKIKMWSWANWIGNMGDRKG